MGRKSKLVPAQEAYLAASKHDALDCVVDAINKQIGRGNNDDR